MAYDAIHASKGTVYWRRQLPRRLAAVAYALAIYGVIAWWAVTGGKQIVANFSFGDDMSWWPTRIFGGGIFMLLVWGDSVLDRAFRTIPRLLYHLHVDHWKLIVADRISKPVARFTTFAMVVILLNLALHSAPATSRLVLPQSVFSAETTEPVVIDAEAIADVICPISRRVLLALAMSTVAIMLMRLRQPPSANASSSFRLMTLEQRNGGSAGKVGALDHAPTLHLFSADGCEIPMPAPQLGASGIPEWCFDAPVVIQEYTWATSQNAPAEQDPLHWRLEGLPDDNSNTARRWHCIHESDRQGPEAVPTDRGAVLQRRFMAPNGRIPAQEAGLLASYYRVLQNPREDRDLFARMIFVKKFLAPPLVMLMVLPWLSVFNLDLKSVVGMTSVGAAATGVALSLAKSEVLENIFAGLLLSAQGTIVRGDQVEVRFQVGNSLQSQPGTVCKIGSAYVILQDVEGTVIQIPNRKVLGSIMKISNNNDDSFKRLTTPGAGSSLNYLSRPL